MIDCVGSAESLATALAVTRPRGRIVLVGMPGVQTGGPDAACGSGRSQLAGAYAYGTETARRRGGAAPSTWPPSWWPRPTWAGW